MGRPTLRVTCTSCNKIVQALAQSNGKPIPHKCIHGQPCPGDIFFTHCTLCKNEIANRAGMVQSK